MKETGLMFKAPLVRAMLEERKAQTRRIAKPVRHPDLGNVYSPGALVLEHEPQHVINRACPYGQPGDRIYVRETFSHFERNENFKEGCECFYRADGECVALQPWRPAIHMPKWAARITLEVTSVRVERLNNISESDCWAEGIEEVIHDFDDASQCDMAKRLGCSIEEAKPLYAQLWEQINGPRSWDANPWVWVVNFTRVTP